MIEEPPTMLVEHCHLVLLEAIGLFLEREPGRW
jgi:hypothetical protein